MKKFLIVPLLLGAILLAGCSFNKTTEPINEIGELTPQDQLTETMPELESEASVDTEIDEIMPESEILVEETEPAVFCTMDAKICPDGSAVGRVAPDCEFLPCPGEE